MRREVRGSDGKREVSQGVGGKGTGAWRSRTYPLMYVFFAALGSGGDSPWGHVLPSGLKRIALEPPGGVKRP